MKKIIWAFIIAFAFIHTTTPILVCSEDLSASIQILPHPASPVYTNTIAETSTGTKKTIASLKVHYIDIGQGDAILLQTPNGSQVLIDTGPRESAPKLISYLKKLSITAIDLLVITHPDFDHIGGIPALFEEIPVKKILDSGKAHSTLSFIQYKQYVWNNIVPVQYAKEKMKLEFDPDLKVKVLNSGVGKKETNDASIVLQVAYGEIKFLFMGDTEEMEEKRLSRKYNLESTILKVAHHGSNSSSTAAFLKDVKPKIAVISAGSNNDFGHPHQPVLNRLIESGADIYNTAEAGDIVFSTDGTLLFVNDRPWLYANSKERKKTNTITITDLDVKEETVTLQNQGTKTIDLTDWKLISQKGYQTFDFPENYKLAPGEMMYITSGAQKKHFKKYIHWLSDHLWNNKGDKAQLFNEKGELVDEIENFEETEN